MAGPKTEQCQFTEIMVALLHTNTMATNQSMEQVTGFSSLLVEQIAIF